MHALCRCQRCQRRSGCAPVATMMSAIAQPCSTPPRAVSNTLVAMPATCVDDMETSFAHCEISISGSSAGRARPARRSWAKQTSTSRSNSCSE